MGSSHVLGNWRRALVRARLADELGLDLSQIAQENMDKLLDRKARGVIGGSGDNR